VDRIARLKGMTTALAKMLEIYDKRKGVRLSLRLSIY
jgi:hypothetical protein